MRPAPREFGTTLPLGIILGLIGGAIASATHLWDRRWKRTAVTFLLGMTFMYTCSLFHFSGAGAMGGLIMGVVASQLWASGRPKAWAKREDASFAHVVEGDLAMIWSMVFQPFGCRR